MYFTFIAMWDLEGAPQLHLRGPLLWLYRKMVLGRGPNFPKIMQRVLYLTCTTISYLHLKATPIYFKESA